MAPQSPSKKVPNRARKDYIGFILTVEKDKDLTEEFLSIKSAKKLHSFFKEQGFTKINEDDCKDIMKSKTKKHSTIVLSPRSKDAPYPCPPNAHY